MSKGVSVSTPATYPSSRFARREEKNEPWQQSWKMMKMRTRNAAAGAASASVTHGWPRRAAITITTLSTRYGTKVSSSSATARDRWGRANGATDEYNSDRGATLRLYETGGRAACSLVNAPAAGPIPHGFGGRCSRRYLVSSSKRCRDVLGPSEIACVRFGYTISWNGLFAATSAFTSRSVPW